MGATTTSRMPHLTSEEVKAALNKFETPTGREWGFDVFDCPIDLFEYIADITVLHKLPKAPEKLSDEALNKAIALGNAARIWMPPNGTSEQRLEMIEVWRQGILLYLTRLFHLSDEVFKTSYLLNDIFRRVKLIPSETSCRFSITWPLFQAGLCLRQEADEQKNWLRNEFVTKFKILGCYQLKLGIGVLEEVWRTGEVCEDHLHDLLI